LAWAVAGASRLIRNRVFSAPPSCKLAMSDWLFGADPVLAWLSEVIDPQQPLCDEHRVTTREAYERFRQWSLAEGFSERTLPSINAFVQRITANATGITYRRTREGRFFVGMKLTRRSPMDYNR
jgi:phage/plasmid-associated DNA primase